MGVIEAAYVVDQEHRPKTSISYAEGIPLIDLSPLFSEEVATASIDPLVSEIGEACRRWGFFQVINHGVPPLMVQRVEDSGRRFFLLPLEEKNKIRKTETQIIGFSDSEHTKNVRDWKQVFDFFANDPTSLPISPDPDHKELTLVHNVWPPHPPQLREACQEYIEEMEKLAYKLLELISQSLGMEPTRLHGFYRESTTYMRLNYYKPCPEPELALGVGRHKDGGALTILHQDDVGGLQVRRKGDGEWLTVKPNPMALIVNVGDVFQVWTNEVYESVEHRAVLSSEKDRFSIPFFFNPAHHTMVEPLKEMTDEQRPSKYKPYNWGKFYMTKRKSNFKKDDLENLQISHFRIPT